MYQESPSTCKKGVKKRVTFFYTYFYTGDNILGLPKSSPRGVIVSTSGYQMPRNIPCETVIIPRIDASIRGIHRVEPCHMGSSSMDDDPMTYFVTFGSLKDVPSSGTS